MKSLILLLVLVPGILFSQTPTQEHSPTEIENILNPKRLSSKTSLQKKDVDPSKNSLNEAQINQLEISHDRATVLELIRGDREGNGGSSAKVQIKRYLNDVLSTLLYSSGRNTYEYEKHLLNIEQIKDTTNILCGENLELQGQRVDAINYPDVNSIVFDCARWSYLSSFNKRQLIIHEYLFMVGVNDQDYYLSSVIINDFQRRTFKSLESSYLLYGAILSCNMENFDGYVDYSDLNYVDYRTVRNSMAYAFLAGCGDAVDYLNKVNTRYINTSNRYSLYNNFISAFVNVYRAEEDKSYRGSLSNYEALRVLARVISMSDQATKVDSCRLTTEAEHFLSPNAKRILKGEQCGVIDIRSIAFLINTHYLMPEDKKEFSGMRFKEIIESYFDLRLLKI